MPRHPLDRLRGLTGARADLTAAMLGALSALALPPVFALPFLLVTIPCLLALIDGAQGVRSAARRGFWFGFAFYVIGLYWITEAILIEAARYWWMVPLTVPALAAVLALFIAGACGMARLAAPGWRRVLVLAGAWTLLDLAREFVLTGFPWNPLGSVWEFPGVVGDVFIQPAAWIGVPGLTLATLLLAATPALGRRAMLAGAAGLCAWAIFGVVRLSGGAPPAPGLSVVLVQGNIQEGQKWNRAFMLDTFRRHLELTARGVTQLNGKPGVVVWPETASPFLLETDAAAREAIARASGGRPALVGTVRFDGDNRPRNSLIALTGTGAADGLYDKWHLVPFGEYVPSWLPVPGTLGPINMVPGTGPKTLHLPGLPAVGPLICYEAIFPGQVVDRADRPAWMVNITNDAWFGNSTGPRQHLAAARMRAVEEGLPLMRAANTGISAGFNAFGHEMGRLPLNTSGVLDLPLPGALPPTPFARWGLLIPALLALIAATTGLTRSHRAGRTPAT